MGYSGFIAGIGAFLAGSFDGDPPLGSYVVRLCASHQAPYGYYDTPEWKAFFTLQVGRP